MTRGHICLWKCCGDSVSLAALKPALPRALMRVLLLCVILGLLVTLGDARSQRRHRRPQKDQKLKVGDEQNQQPATDYDYKPEYDYEEYDEYDSDKPTTTGTFFT